MRPRNLRIEGFTCFRDPVDIDFSGLDVFVISGPTGSGKTTIIDAICYALYGEVPRGTRITDMIARNAPGMQVQLEFDAGGATYRVHRGVNVTRSTNKKTGAEKVSRDISPVQFEVLRAREWEPAADRVGAVDDAIEAAVGLDFDSFTRCVLLPQGQFAEFLAGDRAQRRVLLIDLLDIGIYERVMRAANARAATLNTQVNDLELRLREDYTDATEEALAAAQTKIDEARPALAAAQERRTALQAAHTHATTAAAAYRNELDLSKQLERSLSEAETVEKSASGAAERLTALAAAAAQAEVALNASPYNSAMHAALGRGAEVARQLVRAREAAVTAAAAALDRAALESAAKQAVDANVQADAARVALAAAQLALDDAQRHDAAAHIRSGLSAGGPCPVCGNKVGALPKSGKSTLTSAHKSAEQAKDAESKAAAKAQSAATTLALAQRAIDDAAAKAAEAHATVARREADLAAATPKGIAPEPEILTAAIREQDDAHKAHERLTSESRLSIDALQKHKESMSGHDQLIAGLRAQAKQLEGQIAEATSLRKAEAAHVKTIAARQDWPEITKLIESQKSPAAAVATMLDATQTEADTLMATIATLEADEERIKKAITRAAELRGTLAEMKSTWQLCRELGKLLRADNFQEYVIVEAMQVLAAAASEHLQTLYNRFAISVDGSEFAVIDQWQGGQVRPAKTLSGGETFVASLALALALSERLPELRSSAAAPLESLFLDEGFGTLDPETLEAVITALEGLRSQERMVGIITHVPELAQRVDHRIVVRKSPEGSTVAAESS